MHPSSKVKLNQANNNPHRFGQYKYNPSVRCADLLPSNKNSKRTPSFGPVDNNKRGSLAKPIITDKNGWQEISTEPELVGKFSKIGIASKRSSDQ